MSAVCDTLGVARSNVLAQAKHGRVASPVRRGRPPMPDAELVVQIKEVIGELPTCGYRRVHALLRRRAQADGAPLPNHKRVVMREHGLPLERHSGRDKDRRHDGRVAVDRSNLRSPSGSNRWRLDGSLLGRLRDRLR